jgi:hypothetical protein
VFEQSNVGGCCHYERMSTTALLTNGDRLSGGPSSGIGPGSPSQALPESDAPSRALSDAELLSELDASFERRRQVDSELVRLAADVLHRSRSSVGPDGLAARSGSGSPAQLMADIGRISLAEARRICRVAEATADRVSLLGEVLPAERPIVAEALACHRIPVDSANAIVSALAQASPRADPIDAAAAERALVEFAVENTADRVRTLAARWRDALDVDGVEQREEELIARRSLTRSILANGMKRYRIDLDPEGSAFLDAAIAAQVGAVIRAPRFDSPDACDPDHDQLPDPRTLTQIAADAVVELARHGIACNSTEVPLPSATVVVRIGWEQLSSGLGAAEIDGIEQPVSARTARKLAADAHLIPLVLGGESEILDLGQQRRLFSRAQRIAIAERDGGCAWANCARPPTHTEAHHIRWWSHGGTTDLDNGILLCSRHHHLVHRAGWEVEVRGNVPWFIPPPTVDPYRRRRRGGRVPVPL